MAKTWREIRKALQELPDERLDDDATLFDRELDEFYPVRSTWIVSEDDQDVLDEGHFVLTFNS